MAYNNTQQKEEPIFADGLMFREPHEGAPAFIKGSLNVNVEKFYKWAKQFENEKGWIALDMKESKKMSIYFQLNTWKPKKVETQIKEEEADEELPF